MNAEIDGIVAVKLRGFSPSRSNQLGGDGGGGEKLQMVSLSTHWQLATP